MGGEICPGVEFNAPFTIRHGKVTGTDDLICQRIAFYESSDAASGGVP